MTDQELICLMASSIYASRLGVFMQMPDRKTVDSVQKIKDEMMRFSIREALALQAMVAAVD